MENPSSPKKETQSSSSQARLRKTVKSVTQPSGLTKDGSIEATMSAMTNVAGYSMLYSMAPDAKNKQQEIAAKAQTVQHLPAAQTEESPVQSKPQSTITKPTKTVTPPKQQTDVSSVHPTVSEMTNAGGYTMMYSMAPDDDQPKGPATDEQKIQTVPTADQIDKQAHTAIPKPESKMEPKSAKDLKSVTPPSKEVDVTSVDPTVSAMTNVGGYTMMYSMAPDEKNPISPVTDEQKMQALPTAAQVDNRALTAIPEPERNLTPKSAKDLKSVTPPSKEADATSVDPTMSAMTNVGGYTMMYSMAPDEKKPISPVTDEQKMQALPTAAQVDNRALTAIPEPEQNLTPKSAKDLKSVTPPSKEADVTSVDPTLSAMTNVGGYSMMYSMAPDEKKPISPVTDEQKMQALPTAAQVDNRALTAIPEPEQNLIPKSGKASKLAAQRNKEADVSSVDPTLSAMTNVGGYSMMYSMAPDEKKPISSVTDEQKMKALPTAAQVDNRALTAIPEPEQNLIPKSGKASKLAAQRNKEADVSSVDPTLSAMTNVGGYSMMYSMAPDEKKPISSVTDEQKMKALPTAAQVDNRALTAIPEPEQNLTPKSATDLKSVTPPSKEADVTSVDPTLSAMTNVGGYTMMYSMAPEKGAPSPLPITKEEKLQSVPTTGQQVQSKSRAIEKSATLGSKQSEISSLDATMSEMTNVANYSMMYSMAKEDVVKKNVRGTLNRLAPAKSNVDRLKISECPTLDILTSERRRLEQPKVKRKKTVMKQMIQSPVRPVVLAKPTGRRVMLMRNAERIDRIFPEWVDVSFNDEGKYKPYDLNQPLRIPERHDGYEAYRIDSPITELGNITAVMLGRAMKLGKHLPHRIVVSPAFRCIQTCHSLLKAADNPLLRMQIEPALFEWLAWYEIMPTWMKFSDLVKSNYKINSTYKPVTKASDMQQYQNESVADFYERCINAFRQILESDKKKGNILFIVHSTTIDAITRFLNGMDTSNVSEEALKSVGENYPYCSVLIYEELADDTWRLMPDVLPSITYLDVSNRVNMDFLNRM
ncbi:Protein UBASH3A -like protein [Trichinella murrelli]|uniref:Protein UBASH3A-like protein n=1 Tax=Trichinella murrelli TaxID=144512 RepID=A0A0V0UFA3_9BILA|nr:Protein UBASH3A -like protein [Trichinella murrelli]